MKFSTIHVKKRIVIKIVYALTKSEARIFVSCSFARLSVCLYIRLYVRSVYYLWAFIPIICGGCSIKLSQFLIDYVDLYEACIFFLRPILMDL